MCAVLPWDSGKVAVWTCTPTDMCADGVCSWPPTCLGLWWLRSQVCKPVYPLFRGDLQPQEPWALWWHPHAQWRVSPGALT